MFAFREQSKGKLKKSTVIEGYGGESKLSTARTSWDMFLKPGQTIIIFLCISKDEIVRRVESRVAAWTFLPVENGEAIQILRYEKGQLFVPHVDYFKDVKGNKKGNRVATVLMYLANVTQGGETVFTKAAVQKGNQQRKGDSLLSVLQQVFQVKNLRANSITTKLRRMQLLFDELISVKPKKGDAVLFFSLHPNGTLDGSSMHGSCPVIAGEKWTATKWIHLTPFSFLSSSRRSKECEDENESCARWAAKGECEKNPEYMVGTEESQGYCRKSCKVCS
uniref:procollagen-proline 4-dioxygenase n=1 Tax=Ananas comosus var. bracteatus TaxID=296719 RepID=A0A6V7QBY2_ANACO|nr:unnamed protein product [Ananas comosus var. bracteatus]